MCVPCLYLRQDDANAPQQKMLTVVGFVPNMSWVVCAVDVGCVPNMSWVVCAVDVGCVPNMSWLVFAFMCVVFVCLLLSLPVFLCLFLSFKSNHVLQAFMCLNPYALVP